MQLDLDKVFKERSQEDLQALLPLFRECKTYEERLAFWDEHHLHLRIVYAINTAKSIVTESSFNEEALIFSSAFWDHEEQIVRGVISIAPTTEAELALYIQWGTERRKQMQDRLPTYFQALYRGYCNRFNLDYPNDWNPFAPDCFLEEIPENPNEFQKAHFYSYLKSQPKPEVSAIGYSFEKRNIDFWKKYQRAPDKKLYILLAASDKAPALGKNLEEQLEMINSYYGLDVASYYAMNVQLLSGEPVDLMVYYKMKGFDFKHPLYPLSKMSRTWTIIDTYLRAESDILYFYWIRERKKEYEREGALKVPQLPGDADNIKGIIEKHLKPFSGYWNGSKIMSDVEYNRLLVDVAYMIQKERLPLGIRPIQRTTAPNTFIRKTFSNLHFEIYGRNRQKVWYEFIKNAFKQFEGTEISTIDKKFTLYDSDYEEDVKSITYK